MKILLIGNNSMIGRRLYQTLSARHEIKTAGRDTKADFFLDLTKEDNNLEPFEQTDVMIHCAASFAPNTPEGFLKNERVNAFGAFQVATLAKKINCRHLIYLSSISTYDHPENEYYNAYALSKKHGQDILGLLCKWEGIRFTSLLLSQTYDEYGEARKHQPLLYALLDAAREGREFLFWGNNDPVRNFIYIEDVLSVIEQVIEKKLEGIYPCVHPQSHSLSEVAELAYKVFNRKKRIRFDETQQKISTIYIPSDLSLYEVLAYFPKINLETGLSRFRDVQVKTT